VWFVEFTVKWKRRLIKDGLQHQFCAHFCGELHKIVVEMRVFGAGGICGRVVGHVNVEKMIGSLRFPRLH
jgi:hypothetical protein